MKEEIKLISPQEIITTLEKFKKKINFDDLIKTTFELEGLTSQAEFWDKPKEEKDKILKDLSTNSQIINEVNAIYKKAKELKDFIEEYGNENSDNELINEINSEINSLNRMFKQFETKTYLSDKYDKYDAFLSIHAGQGGTEACDWTEILFRMYSRYAEKQGWSIGISEIMKGTEAGISKIILEIKGDFAYGLLKNETGTHRLVRISPFNAQGLRQTSFAGVEVLPIIKDNIDIELKPEDVIFNAVRSGGAGGQNVNKVSTKVQLIHRPTGIQVQAQSARTQFQNREIAMNLLRAKLFQIEREKALEEKARLKGEHKVFGWGNQIRNYVLQPYKLVKDLRTGVESNQPDKILDGELDEFINAEIKL